MSRAGVRSSGSCAYSAMSHPLMRMAAVSFAVTVLTAALLGFAASPGLAQGESQPPDYFTDCDKEKFEQLPQSAQEGILDQDDREQQKNALDSAAGAVGANCTGEDDPTTADELSEEEDLGEQGEQRDDQQEENQEQAAEDEGSDEEYAQEGSLDEGGGDGGIGAQIFSGILQWAFEDRIEDGASRLADMLTGSAFALPTPDGEIRTFYERTSAVVQPGAVVLLLLTGLMMTLRGTNYNTTYATQSALPKIVIFIAGLAFFPQIMVFISELSSNLAGALLDDDTMANAVKKVTVNQAFLNFTLIGVLVNLCVFILVFGLVIISFAKSFLFAVLFIAGPLAMFLYPIPALSGIATSWFKGTLACTAIPLLWCVEVWVGTTIMETPEMVFGDMPSARVFSSITVIILTWVMIKTPFKVFEYCFYGYTSGGGITSQIGRGVATAATVGLGRAALLRGAGGSKG